MTDPRSIYIVLGSERRIGEDLLRGLDRLELGIVLDLLARVAVRVVDESYGGLVR
jgi:hypothetical protein